MSSDPDTVITPMMKQYLQVKQAYPNTVLFFRMGDFYEMFNQDAVEISRLLNITLTARAGYKMCGFPYHAAGGYIKRLLNEGRKIAICEQVSQPGQGKIVERQVVRVLTPGTLVEEDYLEQNSNNYIACAAVIGRVLSFSYVDVSTGEFCAAAFPALQPEEVLKRELFRLNASELLIQESLLHDFPSLEPYLASIDSLTVNRYPDWAFDAKSSVDRLNAHFQTLSLKGFGFSDGDPELYTCGLLLDYLSETFHTALKQIHGLSRYQAADHLLMDESTLKNLEILKNSQDGSSNYALYKVLNWTKTASGARLLKKWLLNPLIHRSEIEQRHDRVEFLVRQQMLLASLREQLGKILDIERLTTRLVLDKAHAKDLLALGQSLDSFLAVRELVSGYDPHSLYLEEDPPFYEALHSAGSLIHASIADDPSVLLNEGRLIRSGYNETLDRLHRLQSDRHQVLADYLESERRATGIPNLKLKYNRVVGAFLEVTKSNLSQVPPSFIRRQSLVGSERYTTETLGRIEAELDGASEKAIELERELFIEVRNRLKESQSLFYRAADLVSQLDVFQSLAWAATTYNYHRPKMNTSQKISIVAGRHPVVETALKEGSFVPNSLSVDSNGKSFVLITGPNMAGKSTLLRQVALITLMAQMGSFVPAAQAEIGIADRIFCRVGAGDHLARGESTFLVEMNETANILRNATENSLVIMDEVGRGTGTNDGLSIAWAVSEALLQLKIRTLFATHYHELTRLSHPALVNQSMRVIREDNRIRFMKELVDGPAESSYGIYVAQLAGIPRSVIERAQAVLQSLQDNRRTQADPAPPPPADMQTSLFDPDSLLLDKIASYRLYDHTPLQVMQEVQAWQEALKERR